MLNVLIHFHLNCKGQIRKFAFAENSIEKNAFFSKIIKNVLNVRYIYKLMHGGI